MKKIIYTTIIALLAITSCTKESGNHSIIIADKVSNITSFQPGGSYKLMFTANCNWKATTDADWITLDITNGTSGNQVITAKVDVYKFTMKDEHKVGHVTISNNKGKDKVYFTITQYSNIIAPKTLEIPTEGGSASFMIYTTGEAPHVQWLGYNDGLNPDAIPDWATLEKTETNLIYHYYKYTVTAKPNNTGKERTEQIQPCVDGMCSSVKVIQK